MNHRFMQINGATSNFLKTGLRAYPVSVLNKFAISAVNAALDVNRL